MSESVVSLQNNANSARSSGASVCELSDLPFELLVKIGVNLSIQDLARLASTSKGFLTLVHDNWTFFLKCHRVGYSPVKRKAIGRPEEYFAILLSSHKRRRSSFKPIPRLHHFGEAPWKAVFREQFVIQNVNWKTGRCDVFVCETPNEEQFHLHFEDDKAASVSMPNLRLWDFATGHELMDLPIPTQDARTVTCSRFNDEIIMVGFSDGVIIIYSAVDGSVHASTQVHSSAVSSLANPNHLLASGSADGAIVLLQFKDSLVTPVKTLHRHTDCISSLQWQGSTLISAAMDGQVIKWTDTVEPLHLDAGPIFSMQASSCYIVVGCNDSTVRVLDFQTLSPLYTLNGHAAPVVSVHFDSLRIVSGGLNSVVKIWDWKAIAEQHCVSLCPQAMKGNVLTALRTNEAKTQIISSIFNPASGREQLLVLDFSLQI